MPEISMVNLNKKNKRLNKMTEEPKANNNLIPPLKNPPNQDPKPNTQILTGPTQDNIPNEPPVMLSDTEVVEDNKTRIDIAKFNRVTIDRYNTLAKQITKGDKSNESEDNEDNSNNNTIVQSNNEDGIQKCNIKEIDAEERDFNIVFPNFYHLDYYDYEQLSLANKGIGLNTRPTMLPQSEMTTPSMTPMANPIESCTKTSSKEKEKEVNPSKLYQLMQSKQIQTLNRFDSFSTVLYQHKHEIHQTNLPTLAQKKNLMTNTVIVTGASGNGLGTTIGTGTGNVVRRGSVHEEHKVFFKKYNLTNDSQLNEIETELKIYFKLLNPITLKGNINSYLNKIEAYYHDVKNRFFYIFYEYFPTTLYAKILNIDKTNTNPNAKTDSFKEKLKIARHLMLFMSLLHSNGILHRDIEMEGFFYDEATGLPKTFDLSNAYMFPEHYDISKSTMVDSASLRREMLCKTIFCTPRFVAPEITALNPTHGWAQDIWAFACFLIELFLDYSKYEDDQLTKLLNRIFRGEDYFIDYSLIPPTNTGNINLINNYNGNDKTDLPHTPTNNEDKKRYHIPKIPKCIDVTIAKLIANCFYIEPVNRPEISIMIEQFNSIILKKSDMKLIDLNKQEKEAINRLCRNCELFYKEQYNSKTEDNQTKWEACQYHSSMIKHFYCEKCNDLICQYCCDMFHSDHPKENIGDDDMPFFQCEREGLRAYQEELESLEMDKNFEIIDNFSKVFEEDYAREKKKINDAYHNFNNQINQLEQKQLNDLEASRMQFEAMLHKVMTDISKVSKFSHSYNSTKNLFYSHLNRFMISLMKREVNTTNYANHFDIKYKRFVQSTEELLHNGSMVQNKISSLQIPGKYIFKQEQYTEELRNFLIGIETKIKTENVKNFDYSDSDSLSLSHELIMIIPLTDCVFSYFSNAFQKCKVNFERYKVKINSFLPGCATLHLDNFFFISGGEIKDEPTSNFLRMSISEKEISEGPEMNNPRRFHTMLSIMSKTAYYILAIGGWNSNEVEYIDITQMDSWINLPPMKYHRSDPTAYILDNRYLYVFGGWDYTQKKCIGDVERYMVFNDDDEGSSINNNNAWETIVIKGETISLQKYNMGIISLTDKTTENSEKIILVGGFDESYDYSQSIIKIEIMKKDNTIFVNKDIKGLPTGGDSSFWYEKEFHLMRNEIDGEQIAVNFDCFNHLYVYTYRMNEFKQYGNSTAKQN